MKRILVSLVATLLGLVIGYTGYTIRANQLKLRLELHQTQVQKQELDSKFNEQLQKTQELQKLKDDLEVKLQAKKEQQAVLASVTRRVRAVEAPVVVPNCGDNQYAQFIYQHESGCNLTSTNSLNCIGIGQRCPSNGSNALANACPDWRTNYACQNAHFTAYAIGRYGSWEHAYQTWLLQSWW